MRRLVSLLVLAIATVAGATEAKYTLSIGGQSAGTGTAKYTKLKDGGFDFTIDLHMAFMGQTVHMRQEERYDKNARPVRSTMLEEQGGNKAEYKVVYGSSSLIYTATRNGKTKNKVVRYPQHKSIAEPSQYWFITKRPKPHEICNEVDFNVENAKWEDHRNTYVGPTRIRIAGKRVTAFEIVERNSAGSKVMTEWLDGHGMPYRLDFQNTGAPPMRLERATG